MNPAEIVLLLLFAAAFAAAVRHIARHGLCAECGGGCAGNCARCRSRGGRGCPAAKAAARLKAATDASRPKAPVPDP